MVKCQICSSEKNDGMLEAVDEGGDSTVWDDPFSVDAESDEDCSGRLSNTQSTGLSALATVGPCGGARS
jgi:hypothetical protein